MGPETKQTLGKEASAPAVATPDYKMILQAVVATAPSVTDVLARPMVYEAWLKKAQDALNG